jgi:hypothetical protein
MPRKERFVRTFSDNICAHLTKGRNDALHWTFREPRIRDKAAFERLSSKQPGEKAHGGARIAAIDFAFGRRKDPLFPMNDQCSRLGLFDFDPERAQCIHRVHTIFAGKKSLQSAHSIRQGSDDYCAMRDAFIPGDSDLDVNSRRPFYP